MKPSLALRSLSHPPRTKPPTSVFPGEVAEPEQTLPSPIWELEEELVQLGL